MFLTPEIMKKFKKTTLFILVIALIFQLFTLTVSADSSNVVTLGANISEQQKTDMYEYFGTSPENVETVVVNNTDERKYMEGIATEAQIGRKTFSCSYIEPTDSGGIQVKTANLTFVTSSMIASTLATSGIENCNVVAAAPIAVSGTGALTGVMMAYETASGEELNESQKEAAVEELVTTGEIADSIGQDEASLLMNDVKEQVIEDNLEDPSKIEEVVRNAADSQDITLSDEQTEKIVSLMKTISQYDYDVNALKDTLNNLEGKGDGFFSGIWNSIKGVFGGSDGGIINDTKDAVLGDDAVINSTLDGIKESVEEPGLWDKISNFFKGLFGSDDDNASEPSTESTETQTDASSSESSDESTESQTDASSSDSQNNSVDESSGSSENNPVAEPSDSTVPPAEESLQ